MNFLRAEVVGEGTVQIGGLILAAETGGLPAGEIVSLCFRPEDIQVRGIAVGHANAIEVRIEEMEFLGTFYRADLALNGPDFSARDGGFLDERRAGSRFGARQGDSDRDAGGSPAAVRRETVMSVEIASTGSRALKLHAPLLLPLKGGEERYSLRSHRRTAAELRKWPSPSSPPFRGE